MDKITLQRIQSWLQGNYDEETKSQIKELMDEKPAELEDAFYRNLEFGTGGLRGIMGVGTNRMNRYTVGMATQGLANYLKQNFSQLPQIKVAIAYDCRNNSPEFAKITAQVFAASGFKVYLFDSLRPTPELSFTIRHLGCQSGVVITASHNPKEYNGYKAYWNDGAQVTEPHDKNIIVEVNKITDPSQVKFNGNEENIQRIGKDIDEAYFSKIATLFLSPEAVKAHHDLRIVYTPLHGTGITMVPEAMKRLGFTNLIHVPEQDVKDGNFPTVVSPNPEEPGALKLAIEKANATGADIVMATDPDADRVGIAVRNTRNEIILLNGNQTASLLTYYLLRRWKELGRLDGNQYTVKTIVSTELISAIAEKFNVKCYDVYTGFKFIAEVVRENEGKTTFIGGGEESYGYSIGEFVRDKDAITACCMIAEMAAWAQTMDKTIYELLLDIYMEFGFYKEKQISVIKKGMDGLEQIQEMMKNFRNHPPEKIDGSPVITIHDYLTRETLDITTGKKTPIMLKTASNVLQFATKDKTVVSVRPSGTEPKIKFYFGVREDLQNKADIDKLDEKLEEKFNRIAKELGI